MDDMNFSRPKLKLSEERLTEIAEAIRVQLWFHFFILLTLSLANASHPE
jgi:hypothetical protein